MTYLMSTFAFIVFLIMIAGTTSEPNQPAASRCFETSEPVIRTIANGFNSHRYSLQSATANSVKSKSFDNAYFVSIMIDGPNLSEVGTWLVSGSGTVYSANEIANTLSPWPDGGPVLGITWKDDGYVISRNCARGK